MIELDRGDREALVTFVTGKSPAYLRAHPNEPLSDEEQARYNELAARRAEGEPLAYVIGSVGFYRREFMVDARVLIPRPETEHLVEAAIAHLQDYTAARVLDVGTGSGAIALTIAAEVPQARVDAVDASPEALVVAIENRRRLQLDRRVAFYLGDLLDPVRGKHYDAIVANLPYVPSGQGDPELRFEPQMALDGGPDGLDFYRRFFASAPPMLNPGGVLLAEGA
ncbi:MAG TPA: peptide chain release factor N(5)-glutamine methyltransferase, partial [Candidatus Acidoferrales bacterium]|nr:peptide chain release factor N(5)-glutamine methyltransferase [Candidatus Acidoferrales bacterium]